MMRELLKKTPVVLLMAAALLFSIPDSARASVRWSVSLSGFHSDLAPYGTWVTVGNYGSCWRPARISAGWQPYLNGEWLYTDYGWTWVSSDPWGDLPFHYGTWVYDPDYGWVWVPGTVWAPAWVTWCFGDDFVGWAPLPATFALTARGYFGSPLVVSSARYVFVPTNRFVAVNASTARMPVSSNASLLRSGTASTRFSVSGGTVRTSGPDPRRIERATRTPIRKSSLSSARLRATRIDAAGPLHGSRRPIIATSGERSRALNSSRRASRIVPRRVSHGAPNRRGASSARRPESPLHQQAAPTHRVSSEDRSGSRAPHSSRLARPAREQRTISNRRERPAAQSARRMIPQPVERRPASSQRVERRATTSAPSFRRESSVPLERHTPPMVERRGAPALPVRVPPVSAKAPAPIPNRSHAKAKPPEPPPHGSR